MKANIATIWIRVLLAGLIFCAAGGTLYGFAKLVERHGHKVADLVAPRLLYLGWLGKTVFPQAFGLAAIVIFWAFLLSPLIVWIGRWNKEGR
jgi:hypothetical protein